MSITLGSNIASLRGQRQLTKSSAELSTTFERLSSGQRINKASDDAAGLAIADSLNANARVFNQGVRNLNDGLSLLNIADSALENLSGIMIRLEELAEQSANGVYTNKQRKALDGEAQALSDEFFRISKTTEFNGQRLFIGENPVVSLQAGIGQDAIIDASVGGAIGTGHFEPRTGLFLTALDTPTDLASGDLNNDGNIDIVSSNLFGGISVHLGLGSGSFSTPVSFAAGFGVSSVELGDLNGDGVLDLVSVDFYGNQLGIFIGTGNGSFQAGVSLASFPSVNDVAMADLNSDGALDIVTADLAGDTLSIVLGHGDGTFQVHTSIATGVSPSAVSIGDFNGDGVFDIVSSVNGSNQLEVFYGAGNGNFSSGPTLATGGLPSGVAVADLNGDGIQDLVSSDYGSSQLSVFLGTSSGFLTPTTFATHGAPVDVKIADLNGDGNEDLISSDRGSNTMSILLGRGDGTFSQQTTVATGTQPAASNINDFNGDGVYDLASADNTANQVTLLFAETSAGVAPLLEFSLLTLADARQALPVFGRKREQLAAQRGQIGANQAKIEVATNVLTVASENFKAAESRIRDADIAQEAANLTRLNILQQAASSILAQANQQPALALQLLG